MTVDQAVAADRKYFDEHPDEESIPASSYPESLGVEGIPDIVDGDDEWPPLVVVPRK